LHCTIPCKERASFAVKKLSVLLKVTWKVHISLFRWSYDFWSLCTSVWHVEVSEIRATSDRNGRPQN